MSVVHIKFRTRSEEVRGVEELAMNTRITAYRGGVYAECDLTRLGSARISYRLATEQEVQRAPGSIHQLTSKGPCCILELRLGRRSEPPPSHCRRVTRMPHPHYSTDEIVKRGRALYEQQIRPRVQLWR